MSAVAVSVPRSVRRWRSVVAAVAAVLTAVSTTLVGSLPAGAAEPLLLHASGAVTIIQVDHEQGDEGELYGAVTTKGGAIVPVAGIEDRRPGAPIDVLLEIPPSLASVAGVAGASRAPIEADSKVGAAIIADATEPFAIAGETPVPDEVGQAAAYGDQAISPRKHKVDLAIHAKASEAGLTRAIQALSTYWKSSSNGQVAEFTLNATKRFSSLHNCSGSEQQYLAEAAARFGRTTSSYSGVASQPRHLLVVLQNGCRDVPGVPWGLASVGSMIQSGWVIVTGRSTGYESTLIHEFGHNLGLHHANSAVYDCRKGKVFTQNPTCRVAEYWDLYSPMSLEILNQTMDQYTAPALDAPHRAFLNAFKSGQLAKHSKGSKTYTLKAASSSSGLIAIQVVSPRDGRMYFVEYRNGQGQDAKASYRNAFYAFDPYQPGGLRRDSKCTSPSSKCPAGLSYGSGVRVARLLTETEGVRAFAGSSVSYPVATNASYLGFLQNGLGSGASWRSDDGTIAITVLSASGSEAKVEVEVSSGRFSPGTPTIAGKPIVGETLVAKVGKWSPKPTSYSYQWYRGSTAIKGAKSSKYTLTSADAGKTIKVKVVGKRAGLDPTGVFSAPTKKVTAEIVSAKPVVKGKLAKWKTLTVVPGKWKPSGVKLTYQWKRDGQPIKGATGKTYKISSADIGHKISVTVTGSKKGYASASRTTNVGTPKK